jgi:hypothetical protein
MRQQGRRICWSGLWTKGPWNLTSHPFAHLLEISIAVIVGKWRATLTRTDTYMTMYPAGLSYTILYLSYICVSL